MSRPVKQPTPLNNQQQRAFHHTFLHIMHAVYPDVFRRLRKMLAVQRERVCDVMASLPGWKPDGLYSLDSSWKKDIAAPVVAEWAQDFNLSGTWIEEEAQQLGAIWISQEGESTDFLPLTVTGETESPAFQEIVLRIPIPLEFQIERPYFSWDRLQKLLQSQVQPALEAEIRRMRRDVMESGTSVEIRVPTDVDKRMAVTALYLFRGLTPEQIRDLPQPKQGDENRPNWVTELLTGVARERTVLNRWIQEMTQLLGLEEVRLRRVKNHQKLKVSVARSLKNVARKPRLS